MTDDRPRVAKLVLDNGRCPVDEWLTSLRDKVTRARIARAIDRLGRVSGGVRGSVGHGVYELKLDFGPGYRVYYGCMDQGLVVLLGGGDKKTQQKDIEQARERWGAVRSSGMSAEHLEPWSP